MKKIMMICLMVFMAASAQAACDGDLIENGDFEDGTTGITTDYTYVSPPGPVHPQKRYTIHTDPCDSHGDWTVSYGDHTTGTGNMMIVNSATGPDNTVWQQTVAVTTHTVYNLTYWQFTSFCFYLYIIRETHHTVTTLTGTEAPNGRGNPKTGLVVFKPLFLILIANELEPITPLPLIPWGHYYITAFAVISDR